MKQNQSESALKKGKKGGTKEKKDEDSIAHQWQKVQ